MVVKMLAGESSFCFCVVLLLFIVILSRRDCLAKTFEVIRGTPSLQPIAADSYDIGTYIYQGRIIEIRCLYVHNGKCSCNWGGTFVFTKSIKALTPKCFAAYDDLFGNHYAIFVKTIALYFQYFSSNKWHHKLSRNQR